MSDILRMQSFPIFPSRTLLSCRCVLLSCSAPGTSVCQHPFSVTSCHLAEIATTKQKNIEYKNSQRQASSQPWHTSSTLLGSDDYPTIRSVLKPAPGPNLKQNLPIQSGSIHFLNCWHYTIYLIYPLFGS